MGSHAQRPWAFTPMYRVCCFTDDAAGGTLAHGAEGDGSAGMDAGRGSEAMGMAGRGSL